MDIRIIKSPSAGTMKILRHRINGAEEEEILQADAVGLIQGKLIDMICAADIAEKIVNVSVRDVRGSCPQNMFLFAIFGETAAVEAALTQIRAGLDSGSVAKL